MRAVWLLLQAFAAKWKNRRNIRTLIVLIIVMISTFCCVRNMITEKETTEQGKITLGVAQQDTSEYANLLLQYFNENEIFLQYVELIEAEEQKLRAVMEEGELDAYLVIPENFAQSMIDMDNLPIKARVSMENPTKALVLRHVMEAYENYVEAVEVNCTALYRRMREEGFTSKQMNTANVEISLELIFTALGKDDIFRNNIVEREEKATLSLADHYQYTLVYFVLLFLLLPVGLNLIEMKKSGITQRLAAVNVPVGSVCVAAGLPYLAVIALLQLAVCYEKGSMERFLPAFCCICPWVLLFLLLGLLCSDNKKYLFLCSMILVCLAVFGGSLIPEGFLPDSFQKISAWMPNRMYTYIMGGVPL